ncbi:MAG: TonB-dependent receptor [Flavobacteriaceae bacterium]|nr:TonB-dependent receptor [Bacteroidia bacterium]MBT8288902.1 TonB-dependent receptor [Bacteroidia bacterium]NNF74085.1 TonB-dependent receptor [Flavobacteriaceae bacterium]NNK71794.1 TonB-dependent receptor [Flavobacteriaceae bacterium]
MKKSTVALYFLSVLLLSFVSIESIHAQEEDEETEKTILTENLPEIILSATRTLRQLSSLPLPAQLIKQEEIKNINAIRLTDLLSEQTGLITVPDFGGGEGIQLQGLDSQYTLILIDGVPLIGRSAGTLDLNRISVGNIKQIEVVKGASSSLYGSEALGGVINIITEQPKSGFKGEVFHRSGTFNSNDTGLNLNYKKDKIGVNAFVNRYETDGFDLNSSDPLNTVDAYTNYTLSGSFNYQLSDNTNIILTGRYFTQDQDTRATESFSGESSVNEWNSKFLMSHKFNSKWNSQLELYGSRYKATEFLDDSEGNLLSESDFNQLLLRPELRLTFNPSKTSGFIGGLGMNHERLERTDFSSEPNFNSPYIFLQWDTYLNEKLNMILGARFDAHSEYKSQFSPKLALRYDLIDHVAVKGSVGYGFKAPDFRQLYFNFSNGVIGYTILGYNAVNTVIPELEAQGQIANILVPLSEFDGQLSPENSIGINLGIDVKPTSTLSMNLNLFRNTIDDLIDTRIIANKNNGQNVFSYYNINSVYTQGLEYGVSWKIIKSLRLSAGYQLLYAKDKDAEMAFENGEVFARESPTSPAFQLDKSDYFGLFNRSRHTANFKIFYQISKWNANANIRATYRSKFGLFDTNGNAYLDSYDDFVDGYSIWDIAFNKTIFKNYELGIGVDNLFDFTDPQNISNIAGRIIYGTFTLNF